MTDTLSSEKRSQIMSAIRAADTIPEIYVRKILFREGFRYRLNQKNLPGRPDIVMSKFKTVIFIHGCFWHRHECHLSSIPKSNIDFWNKKFEANEKRDKRITQSLLDLGWNVIIIWECALRGKSKLHEDVFRSKLLSGIKDSSTKLLEIAGGMRIMRHTT